MRIFPFIQNRFIDAVADGPWGWQKSGPRRSPCRMTETGGLHDVLSRILLLQTQRFIALATGPRRTGDLAATGRTIAAPFVSERTESDPAPDPVGGLQS